MPENKLSRQFRDASGTLNQAVAAIADDVFFVMAGLATKVKPRINGAQLCVLFRSFENKTHAVFFLCQPYY